MDVLQQWGWPALPIAGDGNIQLTASGNDSNTMRR